MLCLVAFVGILSATGAKAANYSGDCAGLASWDGSGSASVYDTTSSCNISNDVTATGSITIAASGPITAQGFTAGTYVEIFGQSTVTTNDITGSGIIYVTSGAQVTINGTVTSNGGYSISLVSPADISVQAITNSGGSSGDIRIFTHYGASGSDVFNVGNPSLGNGVGTITINHSHGSYIWISDGGSGGITVSEDLSNNASAGISGAIVLDTRSGTGSITFSGSTLSVDNSVGFPGGIIQIMTSASGSIVTSGYTNLSNNGSGTVVSGSNFIDLSSDQLAINAPLNIYMSGGSSRAGTAGGIAPTGVITTIAPNNPNVPIPGASYSTTNNPLSATGSGGLYYNVSGDNYEIGIQGNGVTYTATSNFILQGSNNEFSIASFNSSGVPQVMTIGNLNVSAQTLTNTQTPGLTTLSADNISSVTGPVTLDASSQGGANAGTVNLTVSSGTVPLGSTGNNIYLSSTTSSGGNGGTININGGTADITLADQFSAPNVSVYGGYGNGGTINIHGHSFTGPSTANTTMFANGNGTDGSGHGGYGGTITIAVTQALNIDANDGDFSIIAVGNTAGNGGNVNLSGSTVNLDGSNIYVPATTDGTTPGIGGNITVNNTATLNLLNGDQLDASGQLNGKGGTISLTASTSISASSPLIISSNGGATGDGGTITLSSPVMTLSGTSSFATNGGATSGNGGTVNITTGSALNLNSSSGNFGISAVALNSGSGGTLNITNPSSLIVDGGSVAISAAGNGTGGTINFQNIGQLTVSGYLNAEGQGNGLGGSITFNQTGTGADMSLNNANIDASAAAGGDGSGNLIDITSQAGITFSTTVLAATASTSGNGFGGSVHITAANTLNLSSPVLVIYATGADNGDGGNIVINKTSALSVNDSLKVDGGSSIDSTHFDGSITLNSVLCQQWKTASPISGWPKTYWDCVNPTSPSTESDIALSAWTYLPSTIVGSPGNLGATAPNVQIYAMNTVNSFQEFFEGNSTSADGILGESDPPSRVSAAFNQTIGGISLIPYYKGTILHELGHVWNYIQGNPAGSHPAFKAAVDSDVANFNSLTCATAITANGVDPAIVQLTAVLILTSKFTRCSFPASVILRSQTMMKHGQELSSTMHKNL